MELLLLKYGYLLLFFGVIVEGEVVLIAGSFLASRGYFNVGTVALVALAANTLSAQFYYTAARVRGRGWFEGRFPEKSAYRRIIDWVGTRDNWLLLVSRFLFGFRIVIPAACGAFGMPVGPFHCHQYLCRTALGRADYAGRVLLRREGNSFHSRGTALHDDGRHRGCACSGWYFSRLASHPPVPRYFPESGVVGPSQCLALRDGFNGRIEYPCGTAAKFRIAAARCARVAAAGSVSRQPDVDAVYRCRRFSR